MYERIEFVRNAESLWGKIESKWDWLGVHPDKQFVVGYPRRREGIKLTASGTVVKKGATEGEHGVRVRVPRTDHPAGTDWYASEQQAKAAYGQTVERERKASGPGIVKVERVEQRKVVEREFVVRRPSSYG